MFPGTAPVAPISTGIYRMTALLSSILAQLGVIGKTGPWQFGWPCAKAGDVSVFRADEGSDGSRRSAISLRRKVFQAIDFSYLEASRCLHWVKSDGRSLLGQCQFIL